VAGAAAAAKDVAAQAVKDGYAGLKALIVRKFGGNGDVQNAVEGAEKRPDSEARQAVLKEELQTAGADKDAEVLKQAQALLELLKQSGALDDASYSAINTGSGAIAQGPGAVAAGAGGIAIGGNVGGSIVTGTNIAGDLVQGDKVLGDKISRQINTGGGAFVGGSVNVSGGDFVGRDKVSFGPGRSAEDARSRLSTEGQQIARLLDEYFNQAELADIGLQLKLDWKDLKGKSRFDQVSSLAAQCESRNLMPQLKAVMRLARPQLRPQLK
jgi:hypothetical protein